MKILISILLLSIESITLNTRLNSKNCSYKLLIEPIVKSKYNDEKTSEKFQNFKLKITESLENNTVRDFEKVFSKNFQIVNIKLKNTDLFKENQMNNIFDNYTFLFENNLIYFKNSDFKIKHQNKINFLKKEKFEFEIFNLNCDFKLPLVFYDKTDFIVKEEIKIISVGLGIATAKIFHYDFEIYFSISSVNKVHVNYNRNEFLNILLEKSFNRFKSYDNQIIG